MPAKADKSLILDTEQPKTRRQLYKAIRSLPRGLYRVNLIRSRWRISDAQRGYYWGYLVVEVAKLIDKDREQTDKVLNALFLSQQWEVAGQVVTVVRSLSDLDAAAAWDYFKQISGWVWTTYQARLQPPNPQKSVTR